MAERKVIEAVAAHRKAEVFHAAVVLGMREGDHVALADEVRAASQRRQDRLRCPRGPRGDDAVKSLTGEREYQLDPPAGALVRPVDHRALRSISVWNVTRAR